MKVMQLALFRLALLSNGIMNSTIFAIQHHKKKSRAQKKKASQSFKKGLPELVAQLTLVLEQVR